MNIATYNIRYDNPGDGPNMWTHRKNRVRDLIEYHAFDVVGVQEALLHQLEFLTNGRFASVGVARGDGKRDGEFAAILYDKARFTVQRSGTFWLSATPDKPSIGWDASLPRICTWAELEDTQTQRAFVVFNSHFDHRGVQAREWSAQLVLQRIPTIVGNLPFFVLGDFNATPNDTPIRHFTAALKNARDISERPPYGPHGTCFGFPVSEHDKEPIDHIFVSDGIRVETFAVLTDSYAGHYPSDHCPVVIRTQLTETV